MTDEQAHLAAVIARPADDLPRLVYADWLEEQGRPEYAEFIRLQCQRAALLVEHGRPRETGVAYRLVRPFVDGTGQTACFVREADYDRYHALLKRERQLFQSDKIGRLLPEGMNADLTLSDVGDWKPPPRLSLAYLARGFVHAIDCAADRWLRHDADLLTHHPIEDVRLTTWPEVFAHRDRPGMVTRLALAGRSGHLIEVADNVLMQRGSLEEVAELERESVETLLAMLYPGRGVRLHLPPRYHREMVRGRQAIWADAGAGQLLGGGSTRAGWDEFYGSRQLDGLVAGDLAEEGELSDGVLEAVLRRDGQIPDGYRAEVRVTSVDRPFLRMSHLTECDRPSMDWARQANPGVTVETTIYRQIDLRPYVIQHNAPDGPPTRTRVYAGHCDRCRTAFVYRLRPAT